MLCLSSLILSGSSQCQLPLSYYVFLYDPGYGLMCPVFLAESIVEYLGTKEVKFMVFLQVETKQDKFENKVLVGITFVNVSIFRM